MVNIDSCCFSVHENDVKPDISKFDKIVRQKTETSQTYYEAKNICLGLNKITYMPETGIVTFDISGKLLPIQHKQLISQSNIENCFDIINGTGYVKADMLQVLENSTVRKIDFTENLEVSNVNEYLQAVSCISSQKYNKDVYNGRGNDVGKTGVVFRGTFKTFKEYLLFYDKQAETKKPEYKNILRIESKRSTFDSIRKDVKAQNNLFDILTSSEKPVLNVYSRITGTNETNFKLYDNMKNIKNTQQLLYEALLLQSGNNMQTVKQFLLMSNKSRATAYRHLKQIEVYKRNRNSTGTNTDYLKDILLKLSA
jgi:hypothetical protein